MARHWHGGSTRAWRVVRAYVLERDGHECQLRLDDRCTTVATHAHHTRDRDVYGDDPEYIVAACAGCNIRTGDPVAADPDPNPDW